MSSATSTTRRSSPSLRRVRRGPSLRALLMQTSSPSSSSHGIPRSTRPSPPTTALSSASTMPRASSSTTSTPPRRSAHSTSSSPTQRMPRTSTASPSLSMQLTPRASCAMSTATPMYGTSQPPRALRTRMGRSSTPSSPTPSPSASRATISSPRRVASS